MRFLVFAVAALFAVAVVRAAWIGDDALITMRVVDNFVHGDGMRWNIADRVQISIHPLWMLVVSAVYAVWRDPYWAMMLPSLACMVGATWLLIRSARSLGAASLALACLVASKALCDYSTSGLENPLTMLLLVVALRLTEDAATSRRSFQRLCIVTGLIVLNRFDQALVVLPLWIAFGIRHPWRWALTAMLVGMLPLLAWLAFATFYFGTPLPIIGHAKLLSLGVGTSQLAAQAVQYFVDSWQRDPVTLVVIACGIVIAAVQRTRTSLAVVAAVLFCCAYIFRVGGDFMSGRFFVTPLFLVALVVARLPWLDAWRPRRVALCVSAILGAGFLSRPPTLLSPTSDYVSVNTVHGVVCERAHYYKELGLLSPARLPVVPRALEAMVRSQANEVPLVVVKRAVGYFGVVGGRAFHIVDPLLTDPLLARLPVADPAKWLPGHGTRHLPNGYLASVQGATNKITHPTLRRYYDDLLLVTRGPLLSLDRLRAMWRLWTDDSDLRRYIEEEYRAAPRRSWPLDRFAGRVEALDRFDARALHLDEEGISIALDAPSHARTLEVCLDVHDTYRFGFLAGATEHGQVEILTSAPTLSGLRPFHIAVPEEASLHGFDVIRVEAVQADADGIAAIGPLELR